MKYTIDRIEEGIAVCEDSNGNHINIQLSLLPENVKEGDVISAGDSGFAVCREETDERRKQMADRQRSIFKKRT